MYQPKHGTNPSAHASWCAIDHAAHSCEDERDIYMVALIERGTDR